MAFSGPVSRSLGKFSGTVALTALALAFSLTACSETFEQRAGPIPVDPGDLVSRNMFQPLRGTVGEFCALVDATPIPVEGYGIVAGLPNTGSGDMDPRIRELMVNQLVRAGFDSATNGTQNLVPEEILKSREIAVVEVRGMIPPLARKGTPFDLVINSLPNSQATSLANGLLWTTELKVIGLTLGGNDTRTVALGRGPVFISAPVEAAAGRPTTTTQPITSTRALRTGRVLGGGVCAEDRPARLQLYSPNAGMTRAIELTINARFPARENVAVAENESLVSLHVPPEYSFQPMAFIDLVKHLYLSTETPGFSENKAREIIEAFKVQENRNNFWDLSLALQGLGNSIRPDFIEPGYTSPDPEFRFWMARAGACLQHSPGMIVLQEIVKDRTSPFRRQALLGLIEATYGRDTDRASLALLEMLGSLNAEDRILAYQGLLAIRSRAIHTYSVGRKFLLDLVPSNSPPMIYVTQADSPRIALIGRTLSIPAGAIYISPDKLLTVSVEDAPTPGEPQALRSDPRSTVPVSLPTPEKNNVTLYWRAPLGDKSVDLKTTTDLAELIARLTYIPDPLSPDFDKKAIYIGASYQRVAEMLAAMCADHTLDAQFIVQPAPKLLVTPTDIAINGRIEGSTVPPPPPAPASPVPEIGAPPR